jgi:hypothetical protein
MPFIKPCLESVEKFAHEIIVVEGCVEGFCDKRLSIDGTTAFLDSINGDKIKVIRKKQGFYKSKMEMQNEALKIVSGNYVWLLDCDEFYLDEDIEKTFWMINEFNPQKIGFRIKNFFKGCRYIIDSLEEYGPFYYSNYAWRIFKFQKGLKFISHRPPTLNSVFDNVILYPNVMKKRFGIEMFHFGYIYDEQVLSKISFYENKLSNHVGMRNWFENFFKKWSIKNRKNIERKGFGVWYPDRNTITTLYKGKLPNGVAKIFEEANK